MFDELFELLQISTDILEEDIIAMKPEAVIIGGGLWFLRDHLRDFEGYRTALQALLHRSIGILIKVILDRVDSSPVFEQKEARTSALGFTTLGTSSDVYLKRVTEHFL